MQLPARIHTAVERMIAAAQADKLGALFFDPEDPDKSTCMYRLKHPADGRAECFCVIGVQFKPDVLERIDYANANYNVGINCLEAMVGGLDLFEEIGLIAREASAFQQLHDATYEEGFKSGDDRNETNRVFIERLRSFAAGGASPYVGGQPVDGEPLESVGGRLAEYVDFSKE
jgi:hypothetical protein